ncbi:MAG: response regulator [Verrucomicrobiales bacterium]|nr:response regulator [Verrucomicrobiales bacterium]
MKQVESIRILVLEPDGTELGGTADAARQLGYEVVATCQSGEEALEHFEDLAADLVLSEVRLAGQLDGIDTALKLLQRRPVAIVYVTDCADLATVARARETQPHGYLLKPYTLDELRLCIEMAATRYLEEEERRRREQSYFEAFQSLSDGVIACDLAGVVVFMNTAAERITGWKPQDAGGRSLNEVFRIFHGSGERAEAQVADLGGQTAERTVWLTTRDGERVAIQDRTAAMRDQRNSLTGMIILFRRLPVADLARPELPDAPADAAAEGSPTADEELTTPEPPTEAEPKKHTPAPLVDVVESISDPLMAIDGRWRMVFANGSASRLFDRPTEKLLGVDFWSLLPPAVREAHFEALARGMLRGEAVTQEVYWEARQSWLELRGYPFAEGLLLLVKDVTAQREEAERRSRMDRLESLGLLARGFAHDFNNLLTVLLGNLSLAEMRLRGKSSMPELATAKQATLQAQSLVQQLLTFARGGAPIKRPTRLEDLVDLFFQHHTAVPGIHYEREVEPHLPEVALDPAQIRRLLSNLIRNAEQAQPDGGHITVRCYAPDLAELFPGEREEEGDARAHGLVLEVRDQGEGIPAESLSHIFEPYFSTRKESNATGLGLTVCESIAKAHGGSISVRSEAGRGTTVRFYLPIDADSEEADPLGLTTHTEAAPTTMPRILVLEDDPLVSSLITRHLTAQGYEVTATPEGSETVRAYQEAMNESRIYDLVILDLSVPNGMGGVRTMEKLRGLDPDVVAIVSSGYSDDPVMAKPAAYGFTAVLPKPYEPADLLRLVQSVLTSKGMRSA